MKKRGNGKSESRCNSIAEVLLRSTCKTRFTLLLMTVGRCDALSANMQWKCISGSGRDNGEGRAQRERDENFNF